MAKKQSGKGRRRFPKAALRLPDLDRFLTASVRLTLNEGTGMRSRSSLNGTARIRGYRSARPSSSVVASTWSLGIWRPAPSISVSALCAALPTRRDC